MKLIDQFNHQETNLIISGYPERDRRGENNYGIAWYTKETIEPIAKKYGTKFVVLSETNHDNEPKLYVNGKILVLRVFDQKHHSFYPVILKWLLTFNHIKNVFVHSEFCTNGGVKNFILLIPFLALIKLCQKNITYFAHNVVTDLTDIAPHLDLDKKSLFFQILNFGIKRYYQLLGMVCDRIIVMDEEMKRRLINFVNERKVDYYPFWIKPKKYKYSKDRARKELGLEKDDFILLYFGFVTWYKGADWIIKNIKYHPPAGGSNIKNKKIKLILAGGPAYSLKDKDYYQKYYREQLDEVKDSKNIRITGFVKEEEIGKYFTACDLVIFPYRGLIGSSGAMTYAISYKKPFIVSDKMKSVFNNKDFQEALSFAGIKSQEMTFSFKDKLFEEQISEVKNKTFLNKISKVAKYLARKRSFTNLLTGYNRIVFSDNYNLNKYQKVAFHAFYPFPAKSG